MAKHEIIFNEDQEKIALVLSKLNGKNIDQWVQEEISEVLSQIGHDVIHSYLNEIRKETPTVKEFKDAGISEDDVNQAFTAAKKLGSKFKFDD